MAVRQMMDHLPHGPAAGTIRSVEMLGRKPGNGGLQAGRRLGNVFDALATLAGSEHRLRGTFSDGITQVLHVYFPSLPSKVLQGLNPLGLRSYKALPRDLRGESGSAAALLAEASSALAESKNCCTILRATPSIMRCPTEAIRPPTCASPA